MYEYSEDFHKYTSGSSDASAQTVAKFLMSNAPVESVLDIGCSFGTWLRTWRQCGVKSIQGVDGPYVSPENLRINPDYFQSADLSQPLDLGRKFDLVQSLEVAEHIAPEASRTFVDTVTRHAKMLVLFSAAPPGQGGENHINERSYEFWRGLFREAGFDAYDCIRPAISGTPEVSYWYRYNTILYVRKSTAHELPEALRHCRVPDDRAILDISPLWFRLRKFVVRSLPTKLQDAMAQAKALHMPSGRI